jgi:hypothetical protein
MKLQPIKDVIVNQKRYQISKMKADIGSWLLFKLIDSLRKIMQADTTNEPVQEQVEQTDEQKKIAAEGAANAAIKVMLMNLDEELFAKVQKHALGVCGQYAAVGEEEVVLPVLMANGTFAIPELATDIQTVVFLTSQSLFANLSPFFLNGGFNNL